MTDTIEVAGAPALSEAEAKYFETGGETELPSNDADVDSEGDVGEGEGEINAGDGGQKKDDTDKNKSVPIHALHEERERRKASDKRLREMELENVKFRERFSILERLQSKPEQPKAPPTPEEDIFGAFNHLNQQLADLQKRQEEGDAAAKQNTQVNELVGHYRNDAAAFEAKTPDFQAAYSFLMHSRAQELQALGYESRADLEQALVNEEISIATLAFQKGKSPAEVIYNLAKGRGYQKVDAKAATEAKLDTIERGASLNKSLSNAAGASGEDEMTAERLLAMPNDEFEAWCEKNPSKARRLMGA